MSVWRISLKLYSLEEYNIEEIYRENSYFLLGYANLTNKEIEEGILLLLKILKKYYMVNYSRLTPYEC